MIGHIFLLLLRGFISPAVNSVKFHHQQNIKLCLCLDPLYISVYQGQKTDLLLSHIRWHYLESKTARPGLLCTSCYCEPRKQLYPTLILIQAFAAINILQTYQLSKVEAVRWMSGYYYLITVRIALRPNSALRSTFSNVL